MLDSVVSVVDNVAKSFSNKNDGKKKGKTRYFYHLSQQEFISSLGIVDKSMVYGSQRGSSSSRNVEGGYGVRGGHDVYDSYSNNDNYYQNGSSYRGGGGGGGYRRGRGHLSYNGRGGGERGGGERGGHDNYYGSGYRKPYQTRGGAYHSSRHGSYSYEGRSREGSYSKYDKVDDTYAEKQDVGVGDHEKSGGHVSPLSSSSSSLSTSSHQNKSHIQSHRGGYRMGGGGGTYNAGHDPRNRSHHSGEFYRLGGVVGKNSKHYKEFLHDTKLKEFANPWINIMGITDEATQKTLEERYIELSQVEDKILELQKSKLRLEMNMSSLEKQAAREMLNVQLTTEKLEEFVYI
ncbi:hypothetical protein KGF56_002197 [Candida oxycetoniae]|uniref:Transcription regulator LGE1 helical region domain-containing protein n=1 Tax=Candida oxycetoniae TaxID=497107 RepID=A0AAI9SXX7_9ASCO|nr:uncharacterized protein KGF56_002197 [Candida oxycetoniae]KAI3405032.2 hypothetical protein KGF56_002197 [Candida oxycetoniae]